MNSHSSSQRCSVAVALSGGVDSSVAAALLKRQGHDVTGVTLRLGEAQHFRDARRVAETLGIPHFAIDARPLFREKVIDYFTQSYLAGETPNPCIVCNETVKFGVLLEEVIKQGAQFLATGHYVRVRTDADGVARLLRAKDPAKDQSYVLYRLNQDQLRKVMFPLGEFTKTEIRAMAREWNLPVADKPDSQEICFVPGNDYRGFLERSSEAKGRIRAGEIRDRSGKVLGTHRGLPYYTLGQREGLGIGGGTPLYVIDMDRETNALIVGPREDAMAGQVSVRDVTWISGRPPEMPLQCEVKIRYKHEAASATIRDSDEVVFNTPQFAPTPGQSAVFYQGDEVIGGGVIDRRQA